MSVPAPEPAAVFRACVVNAVKQGGVLIADLVQAVRQALAREEGLEPGSRASQAQLLLARHEAQIVRDFPMVLLELFAQGGTEPAGEAQDGRKLSLVDNADVSLRVEMVRVRQQVAHVAASALSELDALISAAQGLGSVQPERNPLRPGNYVRALYGVVGGVDAPKDVRQAWLGHMQRYLGPSLFKEYQRVCAELKGQGIRPVRYAVGGKSRRAELSESAFARAASRTAHAPAPFLSTPVRGPHGGNSSGWDSMQSEMDGGARSAFARSGLHGDTFSGGQPQPPQGWAAPTVPGALGGQPTPEHVAGDLLAQMMDTIAQDARLLPAVRRAALDLEPVLRRLVRDDLRFFFNEWHPARRLLDMMTARSMEFGAPDVPGYGDFVGLVERVVGELTRQSVDDAEAFEHAVRVLEGAQHPAQQWQPPEEQAPPPPSEQIMPRPAGVNPAAAARSPVASEAAFSSSPKAAKMAAGETVLNLGEWVEIATGHGAVVRTQLTWCSPHQTLFLFTQPDGDTRTMTRRMVVKSLAGGSLKRIAVPG